MTLNFLSQLTGSFAQPAAEKPTVSMVVTDADADRSVVRRALAEALGV